MHMVLSLRNVVHCFMGLGVQPGATTAPSAPMHAAVQQVSAVPNAVGSSADITVGGEGGGGSVQAAQQLAQVADKREDAELEQAALRQRHMLPKTIEGFKKHPLYVLKRHITKYQGLKPGTAPLGLHRGEPYFDRSALSELHSVVQWKRKCREVLAWEVGQPYKLIKHGKKGKDASSAAAAPGVATTSTAASPEAVREEDAEEVRRTTFFLEL
jgi:xeroderma pigmentosum group C-complementing protein